MYQKVKRPIKLKRCPYCGCYCSDRIEHDCKENPMLGKKHSEETKRKIGEKSKNRMKKEKTLSKKELISFKARVRVLREYKEWRKRVIENSDVDYVKGMQVHHIKSFNEIIEENNITTFDEAKACKDLWDINNGVVLKKGEHYVMGQLERMKYNTQGFLKILSKWLLSRGIKENNVTIL